jgi:phosphoadenosine phosphosulfate reductase
VEVELFQLRSGATLKKISPLARWTTADVSKYIDANGIPVLPLYEQGYTSVLLAVRRDRFWC